MNNEFVTPINPLPETVEQNGSDISQTPRAVHQVAQGFPAATDNTNKHFKGQQKHEVVTCFCRKHWLVLVPHFIGFLAVLALVTAFFFINIGEGLYQLAAPFVVVGLTIYLHYFFLRIFNYYLQILIVTNYRVIMLDQTLYFRRSRDSIDLPEIQNIEVRQKGILETLLSYGELIITLSSAHATKVFSYVPNPEYHFRKINKTKREYITLRRLEKAHT